LSDLEGHSAIASLFTCDVSYSYATVNKISTDLPHRSAAIADPLYLLVSGLPAVFNVFYVMAPFGQ